MKPNFATQKKEKKVSFIIFLSFGMHTFDFDLVSEWQRTHFHSTDVGKTIDWVIHRNSKTERQKFYGGKSKYSLFLAINELWLRWRDMNLFEWFCHISLYLWPQMVLKLCQEFPTTSLNISINYHYLGSQGSITFSFYVKFHIQTLYRKLVSVLH